MKLIFMGTPDFAVPSLEALHTGGFDVALVISQPDRPKGRGRKVIPPSVKTAAQRFGYPVIQPESMRSQQVTDRIRGLSCDFLVVVAFGHILQKTLLSIPKIAAVNVHASLLPKYRGPAPIQWAVINGESKTGVTTMLMDQGLDTGDILLSESVAIRPDDTAETLHDRLAEIGADLLTRTLQGLVRDDIVPVPQNHAMATSAPLIRKGDGKIDWSMPPETIDAFVRGMNPRPGAYTFYGEKRFKIYRAQALRLSCHAPPGTVIEGFPDELRVAAGEGGVSILELQGASGKRLPIAAFLRGSPIPVGAVFQ